MNTSAPFSTQLSTSKWMENQRKQRKRDERRRSSSHDKAGLHRGTKQEFDELLGFLKRPSSRKIDDTPQGVNECAIPSSPEARLGWFHKQIRECCVT
jgi:hypothetical protein